ncbi:hypothetical protein [Nonomuraea glycinis]|uniref:hypothetical protein n=1 Tax=Nonomuraea glycinis TaxID=2047744 RepID=UPI002E0D5DD6|nr:hypothetical protein OHA68_01345 [Nonomuraea glycinis]
MTRLPAGSESLTMYCVLIVVDTPGRRVSGARVRAALTDSAAGNDRTEHIFMDVRDGLLALVLYLRAADLDVARLKAEQLCRRAMAVATPPDALWMIRSTTVL